MKVNSGSENFIVPQVPKGILSAVKWGGATILISPGFIAHVRMSSQWMLHHLTSEINSAASNQALDPEGPCKATSWSEDWHFLSWWEQLWKARPRHRLLSCSSSSHLRLVLCHMLPPRERSCMCFWRQRSWPESPSLFIRQLRFPNSLLYFGQTVGQIRGIRDIRGTLPCGETWVSQTHHEKCHNSSLPLAAKKRKVCNPMLVRKSDFRKSQKNYCLASCAKIRRHDAPAKLYVFVFLMSSLLDWKVRLRFHV